MDHASSDLVNSAIDVPEEWIQYTDEKVVASQLHSSLFDVLESC